MKRYLDRVLNSDNLLQFIDTGKTIKNFKKTVFGYKYLIKIDQQLEDGMILFLFNTQVSRKRFNNDCILSDCRLICEKLHSPKALLLLTHLALD